MAVELSSCLVNGIEPVQFQILDNQVSTASQAYARGVAFNIHGQLFSARPILGDNNTFVATVGNCDNSTDYSCIASLGGVYTPPADVESTVDPTAWNGTLVDWLIQGSSDGANDVFYNDRLRIGPYTLDGFPFYTYEYTDQNLVSDPAGLGLATNSSFLEAALAINMTGTRQFSIWPGNYYNNVNGLLILGGYDEARVDGDFQTFRVEDDLYFDVQITRMSWENSTSSTNIMPSIADTGVWATFDPYYDWFDVETEMYNKFIAATGPVLNTANNWYEWSAIPEGNIVMTFNNGHRTVIPAQDIFRHPQDFNSEGTLVDTNSTVWRTRVYPNDGELTLGTPFMTQKVFVANWDNGTFQFANAVKDDFGGRARNLQPLCTPGPTPNNNATGQNGTDDTGNSAGGNGGSGTNVAAIAGGVGGGIGGLLVIGLIAFFVLRRRKKQKTKQEFMSEVAQPGFQPPTATPPPRYPSAGVFEKSDRPTTPQEMYSPMPPNSAFESAKTRSGHGSSVGDRGEAYHSAVGSNATDVERVNNASGNPSDRISATGHP